LLEKTGISSYIAKMPAAFILNRIVYGIFEGGEEKKIKSKAT